MIRRFLAIAVLAVLPVLTIAADFPLTGENATITFVGSKPQGKHEGGFKKITGVAKVQGADVTSLSITLDIETDSLYSDNAKLTTHLKSPDFFGVASNPKAKFESTKVEKSGDEYKITGKFTMLGKTNEITVPAKITVTDETGKGTSLTLTTNFAIDRTKWGMTYGQGKIDDQVKLSVSIKAKK